MDSLFGWRNRSVISPTTEMKMILFKKKRIPLASLATVRTLAEKVNAEFTVMPRSLIGLHFYIDLPPSTSDRAIRKLGEPPTDR